MLTRLLAVLGLAPATQVASARDALIRLRVTERARAQRERAGAELKIDGLEKKLEAAHERHVAEYAERSTLKKALSHHWDELNRVDTIYGSHVRRVPGQFAIGVEARQRGRGRLPSSEEAQLASVCPEYSDAVARWQQGTPPVAARRVSVAGVEWSVPVSDDTDDPATSLAHHVLPLDELAMVRQFAVGGVMLDIGAAVGQTSIPRIVLGDFSQAYVTEPNHERYLCLVGNAVETGVQGELLPDHVAISGQTTSWEASRFPHVPCLTFGEWMTRLHVPADRVRFVRIGARGPAVEILKAGVQLMPRRDIVWQIDIDRSSARMTPDALTALPALISRHFTHFKEVGAYPAEPWRRAVEAKRLFKNGEAEGPTGLLLFNLR